jgi:hypothetical protein
MGRTLEGGCQCGRVRYRVTGRPLTFYACHCTECRKQSASAFGLSLWVKRPDFALRSGEPKFWERPADSGDTTVCAFCPDCGTRLYHFGRRDPDILSLKAGALDDTAGLVPVGHIWTRSKQAWVDLACLPGGDLAFETEPPDFQPFLARWTAAYGDA